MPPARPQSFFRRFLLTELKAGFLGTLAGFAWVFGLLLVTAVALVMLGFDTTNPPQSTAWTVFLCIFTAALFVGAVLVMEGTKRRCHRRAGLRCPSCGYAFRGTRTERRAILTRRCPGCKASLNN